MVSSVKRCQRHKTPACSGTFAELARPTLVGACPELCVKNEPNKFEFETVQAAGWLQNKHALGWATIVSSPLTGFQLQTSEFWTTFSLANAESTQNMPAHFFRGALLSSYTLVHTPKGQTCMPLAPNMVRHRNLESKIRATLEFLARVRERAREETQTVRERTEKKNT